MGYYTDFEIVSDIDEICIDSVSEDNYTLSKLLENGEVNSKWYSWDKDLKELSLNNKDKLIIIYGVGEEHGDEWKAYFLNGKSAFYRPQVIYPEFNEGDLK